MNKNGEKRKRKEKGRRKERRKEREIVVQTLWKACSKNIYNIVSYKKLFWWYCYDLLWFNINQLLLDFYFHFLFFPHALKDIINLLANKLVILSTYHYLLVNFIPFTCIYINKYKITCLPIIIVFNLFSRIMSLSNTFIRCWIDELKSMQSTKFHDCSILCIKNNK